MLPVTKALIVTTAEDNQTCITLKIVEGERGLGQLNFPLGTLEVHGVAPAPAGTPVVTVSFDMYSLEEADSLLVTAQVVGLGNPVSGRFSPMQARSSPEEQFNVVHAAYLALEEDASALASAAVSEGFSQECSLPPMDDPEGWGCTPPLPACQLRAPPTCSG